MKLNIIFDIGFVLIEWNPDFVYDSYFKNKDLTKLFYEETGIFKLNSELDKGLPFDEGLSQLVNQFPHYSEPIQFWKNKWSEMIIGEVKQSIAILRSLFDSQYPLFGLTNWSAETFPYVLNKYEFLSYFKDIVVSGHEKVIKPDPAIYHILLNRNNLRAENCLFIDDNSANVEGAKVLGIDAIKFENPEQLILELNKRHIYL